ncbi:MAG: sulfite exporter TauE/SafE family protein [Proteobacteria bacterium]|nr:sulfite exporter TauE/SafE family protein [Pseudomonadota bacterium]
MQALSRLPPVVLALWSLLLVVAATYIWRWWSVERTRGTAGHAWPTPTLLGIGFGVNFLDTLGVSSFATTTAVFRLGRLVRDEHLPGTLNAGHALPTVIQALVFIVAVQMDTLTLIAMILAAVLGAFFGAQIVTGLPRRAIQLGMGTALLVAAGLFLARSFELVPGGGAALGLSQPLLAVGVAGNFVLGALMTLGIGLFAPCLILVSLLGLNPLAAFPIMMGSCAFLMPVAGMPFVRSGRYDGRAAVGLALGGIPGVLIAAFIVRSLPLKVLNWLVFVVVLYTAITLLWSALHEARRGSSPA